MDDEKYDDIMNAVALMGRNSRWSVRRIARQAGMHINPGYQMGMYINGHHEVLSRPDEDLAIWEDGELTYNEALDATEPRGEP